VDFPSGLNANCFTKPQEQLDQGRGGASAGAIQVNLGGVQIVLKSWEIPRFFVEGVRWLPQFINL